MPRLHAHPHPQDPTPPLPGHTSLQAALASFAELHADSPCDNVLLEHLLALEQVRSIHA